MNMTLEKEIHRIVTPLLRSAQAWLDGWANPSSVPTPTEQTPPATMKGRLEQAMADHKVTPCEDASAQYYRYQQATKDKVSTTPPPPGLVDTTIPPWDYAKAEGLNLGNDGIIGTVIAYLDCREGGQDGQAQRWDAIRQAMLDNLPEFTDAPLHDSTEDNPVRNEWLVLQKHLIASARYKRSNDSTYDIDMEFGRTTPPTDEFVEEATEYHNARGTSRIHNFGHHELIKEAMVNHGVGKSDPSDISDLCRRSAISDWEQKKADD